MTTDLIVFDFDGTLADTTATILSTYRMTIRYLDAPDRSDGECQSTIGLPLKEGFRQLYPDFSEDELDECVVTYRRIFNENKKSLIPKLYCGVEETLQNLFERNIRMSIASSRSHDSLVEFCDINGLTGYFDLILGADDVPRAKPDPEPVLITMDRLGFKSDVTMVVGDMPVDIVMGRDAGCRTTGVAYGNSSRNDLNEAGADYVIDSFQELFKIVSDNI